MTFADLIGNASGNLWRMKLRASLTISGVVIAIAAFVSMLSFGAGMQEKISSQFSELGLLSTMLVYPKGNEAAADTVQHPLLDAKAVEVLSGVPGVNLAYPYDDLMLRAMIGDTVITTHAQALPEEAVKTKLFSKLVAGTVPTPGSTKEALATQRLLRMLKMRDPDSLVGSPIVVSMELVNLDSGVVHFMHNPLGNWRERLAGIEIDSLQYPVYLKRVAYKELGGVVSRFAGGLLSAKAVVVDTLVITGVLEGGQGDAPRRGPLLIPLASAVKFKSGGFSDNPADLLAALRSGTLISSPGDVGGATYPRVTLDLNQSASYDAVKDSVENLGYRTFSYVEQFQNMRRFFFYFKIALGIVGMIALLTASLGIVNTMVMSILERTREIGVLKSLGADDRDIRFLFLAESGMIGTVGAFLGIVAGWLISRVASFVAQLIMERQGIPQMELFALPWWLITTALVFGLLVSLGAGLYPALRAARVDPVQALRNE